jgi:hypothetical protein
VSQQHIKEPSLLKVINVKHRYKFAALSSVMVTVIHRAEQLLRQFKFFFQGKNVEYVQQDDHNRRWFNEFRSKASSNPIPFETVDCKSKIRSLHVLIPN